MEKNRDRKTFRSSTVSRRDFMKMLGVGAGAAAFGGFTFKGFKDLDEMMASPVADRKLPFWVKEVDEPTVEIDWDNYQQFPHMGMTLFNPNVYGMDEYMAMMETSVQNARKHIQNGDPTRSMKDYALHDAVSWGWGMVEPSWTGPEMHSEPTMAFRLTPDQLGVPKYEGSPEENARMVRTAGRIFGAFDVGFVKLTEKTKKFLYASVLFQDVEEGFDTGEGAVVVPDKDLWVVVAGIPQSLFMGINNNWGASYANGYSQAAIYSNRIMAFLKGLGYQAYGSSSASVGIAPAFGVMAGLAEYGRTSQMISPFVGNMFRTVMLHITDLPLAETKPIDAGILEFCKTCKKCAENCPSGALSLEDEPVWITEPQAPWQTTVGVKGYPVNVKSCFTEMFTNAPACDNCQVVCPFTKFDKAALHEVVKATIGITPLTNSLIATFDDAFGYGMKEPEDVNVWDLEPWDVPLFGLDSSRS